MNIIFYCYCFFGKFDIKSIKNTRDDFMIIDFHTHIFPDKIAERAIASLEASLWEVSKLDKKAATDGTLAGIKKSMAENGIDYSVIMPIATNPKQTPSINSFAKEISGKDGVFSFGSVHPLEEDALEVLEQLKRDGFIGIKLHPEYQSFYIDSEESLRVLKKAEELGLYLMLHTGKDAGILPPVHCMPERLKNALNYVDGGNIIAAHMGGYLVWDEVYEHLAGTSIYLDTSYSVGMMDDEMAEKIIRKHGTKKILFGSDSPWQVQGDAVKALYNLDLTDEEKQDIFSNNGAEILKISGTL